MEMEKPHILVVEDNDINRELLARRLEKEHYRVTKANDGHIALGILEAQKFDLVMLDLHMPHVTGFEVLERMQNTPEWKDIPVIVVTSVDEIKTAAQCIQLGASDYITKPYNSTNLLASIAATLDRASWPDRF